ncbi:hypothetical protein O7627_24020 [Solwaraspora sp. WMMD1047]|uniref:hypothetical protein n=1 Tax=Solwaraspora sp. WMMD1047 TaxID=3016102 RepID=UPI0024173751|nr:hypothetical protein [Solwaraspora sp. WMMD1047]MDG4832351.1 hypothetical protein [Solwaraspora sp. WMMD1047]
MAYTYAPEDAVAGDPGALRLTTQTLTTLGTEITRRAGDARTDLNRTSGYWSGSAGDAYRTRMTTVQEPYAVLVDEVLPVIGRACEALAGTLETAQSQLRTALATAASIGLPNRLILGVLGFGAVTSHARFTQHSRYPRYWVRYGNWQAVARYQQQHQVTEAHFQPVVDQASLAFKTAREGRLAFVRAIGGAREDLARLLYREPTAAELKVDREVGAGRVGNFWTYLQSQLTDTDPQGRVMLYRWTEPYGEPAVFFRDGSDTSNYLKDDALLRGELDPHLRDLAAAAVASNGATYDLRTNVTIADGWGTGHETLHGTEATVGDFHIEGTPTVRPLPGGGHEVVLDSTFTWNDIIDPNPQYLEDWVGSHIPGTQPFNIHIEWQERTTVILDAAGRPVSVSGYPAPAP